MGNIMNKRIFITIILPTLIFSCVTFKSNKSTFEKKPPLGASVEQLENWFSITRNERTAWWKHDKFGLFIHFGVYAIPGRGEWVMWAEKIPVTDYKQYAQKFYPVNYNPEEWVKLAKEAGMKYIVITAKHHDGFAVFNSSVTDWDVIDATPYGKDLLKPLVDACKKHGIKIGFYYSQAQDWIHPGGSAYDGGPSGDALSCKGQWDNAQKGNMNTYIDNIAIPQIRELLSNYGDIDILWWDTPYGMDSVRADALYSQLRLQPHIIFNDRLGGNREARQSLREADFGTPEGYVPDSIVNHYWETCQTMNGSWGFKKNDTLWKSSRTLVRELIDIASKGGNYLLNIGPEPDGNFPQPCIERLREIGQWMKINGKAIYGTTASPFITNFEWGRCTKNVNKNNTTLYLHVFELPQDGKLFLPGLSNNIKSAKLLTTNKIVESEPVFGGYVISLPKKDLDSIATVVAIDIQGPVKIENEKVIVAYKWLEKEAFRIIRASKRTMNDNTAAFPPQAGHGYEAFWLRDYEMTLEGAVDAYSNKELKDACMLFVRSLRSDGAGVDCVKFDGTPIYMPGYGTMGENPVTDGSQFTVGVAWHTYHKTKDKQFLAEIINDLIRTMNAVPLNKNTHLVYIEPGDHWDRAPFGFTDIVHKQGDVLFSSLLYVQAGHQLADLLHELKRTVEADYWRAQAEITAVSIRKVFWDSQIGLFRAATVRAKEPDIWGSVFAVYIGVADSEQSKEIGNYLKNHYTGIVKQGQIRHLPAGVYWEKTGAVDTYQNGGFWATPVGWFIYALDTIDPKLADKTVLDMVADIQQNGACEYLTAEKHVLPNYLASASLPLDGFRKMLKRRQIR